MAGPDLIQLATDERRDFADLLATLSSEQWEEPSLCVGWSVKDVVAHVVSYEELGLGGIIGRRLKAIGHGDPNEVGRAEYAKMPTAELLDFLRTHLRPQGLTSWFGGAIGLTDGLIHHQDIRRGLRLPREVPAERVLPTMGFALRSPKLPSRKHVRDVELVATDLDWRHGEGPAVNGTAEALLMTIAGRADALDDLDGPGVGLLRQRLAA